MQIKLIATSVLLAVCGGTALAEIVAAPVGSAQAIVAESPPLRGIEEEIWHTVQDWAAAWSARDAFSFLAFYSKEFRPEDGSTLDDWSRRRRVYFRQTKLVEVTVAFPAIRVIDDKHAKVRFTQSLKAGQTQALDEKSMSLAKLGGLWMITEEDSLSSRVDPIASTRVAGLQASELVVPQTAATSVQPLAASSVVTPTTDQQSDEEIGRTLQDWAKAWSSKQATYFFAFYGTGFRPNDGTSLDVWQKRRREYFQKVKVINVELSEQSIELKGKNRAEVRFTQAFQSDRLKEVSRKMLVLEKVGGSWKIVAEKADPRLAEYQLVKIEAARTEAAKIQAAKVEASKAEAARIEAARIEAARIEAARVEAARVEAARVEAARVEAARVEAAKVEAAKVEAAKVEAARVEAAKVEAAKVEAAKVEAAKAEAAKAEAAKAEAAKAEAAKAEAAKIAAAKVEMAQAGRLQASAPLKPETQIADPTTLGLEAWGAVQAWARAWSALDADAFIGHYGATFTPEDGSARVAWEARRREYFKRVKYIEVGLDRPVIKLGDASHVEIQFDQAFRSDIYREAPRQKWLTLEKMDGQWKIVAERSDMAAQAKLEAAKSAAAKAEGTKLAQVRVEAARAEAARVKADAEKAKEEAARLELARVEAARAEAVRVKAESDQAKATAAKAKAEADKAKAMAAGEDAKAKAEAAKAKADAARAKLEADAEVARAKAEEARAEQARIEAGRAEASKAKAEAVRAKAEAGAEAARSKAAAAKLATAVPVKVDSVQAAQVKQVEDWVVAWANVWAARDISAYLANYGEHFEPAGGESLAAWETQRRARIGKAKTIEVGVEGLLVEPLDGAYVKARFTQHYRADNYRDVVSKTLILENTASGWRIVREEASALGKPIPAR